MRRVGRVLRLGCAGRRIADDATGDQHFDQERQQRAYREEKRASTRSATGVRRVESAPNSDAMPESRKTGVSATWITCATVSTLSNPSMYDQRADERLGFEQTFSETSVEAAKAGITMTLRAFHPSRARLFTRAASTR